MKGSTPGGPLPLRLLRVGLVLALSAVAKTPDVTVRSANEPPRALIVAETHPLARRPSVRIEDLAGHQLIAVPGVPDYVNDYHLPRHTPSGLAIPRGPVAADWQAILTLVAAGRGVFPTTRRASDYYARPGVVFVPFDDAPPIEYAACWLETGENAKVRTFVELLTEITGTASR